MTEKPSRGPEYFGEFAKNSLKVIVPALFAGGVAAKGMDSQYFRELSDAIFINQTVTQVSDMIRLGCAGTGVLGAAGLYGVMRKLGIGKKF